MVQSGSDCNVSPIDGFCLFHPLLVGLGDQHLLLEYHFVIVFLQSVDTLFFYHKFTHFRIRSLGIRETGWRQN